MESRILNVHGATCVYFRDLPFKAEKTLLAGIEIASYCGKCSLWKSI